MIFPSPTVSPARGVCLSLIASLLFLLNFVWIFLHSLGCRSIFPPSLQFFFHESCFTRRCINITDVFMREGELSFLLLHHLDPFPLLFCMLTKALSSAFLELIFCFVFLKIAKFN